MKKKKLYIVLTVIIGLYVLYACRHEIPERNAEVITPPPTSNPCSADSVYFINEIMPIISSNCTMSGCHDVASHKDGVILVNYTNIRKYVSPGDPSNSKLYKVINRTDNERMPLPPMPPLSQELKNKIYKWISQGALNNYCKGNCDSSLFTYSTSIKNTIQGKCIGCHNPSSLGGSVDLSTYDGVRTVALNGKLYGSVIQQPGFSPMPKNSPKLSDCEIKQFQKWINAGAPNN